MTVKETFEAMATRFRPERAQGLQTVIQYDITGPEGCTYHVNIADGQCAAVVPEARVGECLGHEIGDGDRAGEGDAARDQPAERAGHEAGSGGLR